jgi:hypothetical protein
LAFPAVTPKAADEKAGRRRADSVRVVVEVSVSSVGMRFAAMADVDPRLA